MDKQQKPTKINDRFGSHKINNILAGVTQKKVDSNKIRENQN